MAFGRSDRCGEFDLPVDPDMVCQVGIDINARRYGSTAVLRSLFRRDRNTLDALRTS